MKAILSMVVIGVAVAGYDHEWKAVLKPGAGSSITGTAEVEKEDKGKNTEAEISIKGATAGAELPWHVHSGKCGSNGPIVGDGAAYPLLKVKDDGTAKAEAKLAIATPTSGEYYVNVHKSAAEPKTIVACGELTMEGEKAKTAGY